jgi:energy-coupling factor transport system permease protein
LGLATVATRSHNPLVLGLVLAVAGYVVTARRSDAPWSRSFAVFLKLGLVVLTIRFVAQVVFGNPVGGTVLFTLPEVSLPDWAAGVSLGGAVTLESVAAAFYEGLRLATLLACIGAANALANPRRLLSSLPAALYEVGLAVVVALSFAPSLVASVHRIRSARRLRGRPDRGLRSLLAVAMPVIEDALERSLALAGAMDSRGYGRRAEVPIGTRRLTAALTLLGLLGIAFGIYGVMDAGGDVAVAVASLVVGVLAAIAGIALGGRRAVRTRYRPDPWALPEIITAVSGALAAILAIVSAALDPVAMMPTTDPLVVPTLPLLATGGVVLSLLPAWITPPPPTLLRDRPGAAKKRVPAATEPESQTVEVSA